MVIGISILIELVMLISESAAEISKEEIITHSDVFLVAVRNPLSPQYSYQDYLVREAIVLGINPDLAACIINAESGWKPYAQNRTSTAYGLGQFLNSTYNRTKQRAGINWDRHDPYDQIDMFLWLLKEDGYTHWIVWPLCV